MQLHRQLPELREGGARRREDLSDLGAGRRHGGPAHTPAPSRPEPLAPPQPGSRPPPAPAPGGRAGAARSGVGGRPPVAARERCPRASPNLCGR